MAKRQSKAERKRQNAQAASRPGAQKQEAAPAEEQQTQTAAAGAASHETPTAAPVKAKKGPAAPKKPQPTRPASRWDEWASGPIPYVILGVLLTILLLFQAAGSDRDIGFGMAIVFIAGTIGFRSVRRLRDRLCLPALAMFAYLALNAAASLYSEFGNTAPHEFGKILAAFGCYGIILFRARREDQKRLAAMTAAVLAVLALLSIDASSLKALSTPVVNLLTNMGCDFSEFNIGYEEGVRVTGLLGNANILAGMLGLGVFLSLYLVQDTSTRRGQVGACFLLGINALCFLLNFSMGAIAMFFVAVLIYLLAARKGTRLPLFVLMVETAVITLLMAFLSFQGLGKSGAVAAVPLAAAFLGGALLWAVHQFLGARIAAALGRRAKLTAIVVVALIVVIAGYLVLSVQLTGAYTLSAGETLRRSLYPAPGAYTMEGDWSGEVNVTVESQNSVDTMMHTSTVLYRGSLSDASFTVPEDSLVVYFNFSSKEGAQLNQVSLSDGTAVKLNYRLLPAFAANRIQGLFANQNAIQRLVFFQDGMRMYAKSPVIGNGLGSVGGMVHSVQDFYYTSRFVHNHYIEVLVEMGIPGLICFVFLLGSSAVTLWKRRREGETELLLPALCACLAMMAGHAAVEAIWSISAYQTVALLVLATIVVCYGRPLAKLAVAGAEWVAALCLWVFVAIFAWLLWGNMSAERQYNAIMTGQATQTAETMSELAARDHYNWAQYKLNLAVNAATADSEKYQSLAVSYAQELRKLGQYSINRSLEEYHYIPRGEYEEMFAASREGVMQLASDAQIWQDEFDLYEQYYFSYITAVPGEETSRALWYAEQCLLTYQQLVTFNDGRMEQIVLSPANEMFIGRMMAVQASGGENALSPTTLFDSALAADVNSDGVPDLLSNLTAVSGGWQLSSGQAAVLTLYCYSEQSVALTLRGSGLEALEHVEVDGNAQPLQMEGDSASAVFVLTAADSGEGTEHTVSIPLSGDMTLTEIQVSAVQ